MSLFRVKTLNGDLLHVEISSNSLWPMMDLRYAIERIEPNFPRYLQQLHRVSEEEVDYVLTMAVPEVYLRLEVDYLIDNAPVVKRYSISVFHEKQQRASYTFVVGEKGYHLYTPNEMNSKISYIDYIKDPMFMYEPVIEDAMQSLPEIIRDLVLRKWANADILSPTRKLPYTLSLADEEEW